MSDKSAAAPPRPGASQESVCPFCAHRFYPGGLASSYVFCPACGRKFNPNSVLEETVCLEPGGAPVQNDADIDGKPRKLAIEGLTADEDGHIQFGDYDILSEVARGGMGVVYRAQHRRLRRVVALKVLRSGEGSSEEDIRRFMQEAKSAASLTHPNIVPIHDLSAYRGQHYFTMDYIEGQPLDQLLEQGALAPYRACELLLTIARAIHYAHTRGIIHRDIKPGNVIIDPEGRPMLTDFGLAVNLSTDRNSQRMTRTGAVMGTIPYIPPEQASGRLELIGTRSDIYSLGALFYEMLTGRPPFTGMTQYELLQRVIHHYPPAPRKIRPRISADLETICMKCLSKEPDRRYQNAAELADDCQAFLDGEVIRARPSTLLYRMRRAMARHPELTILGVVTLLLGLILLGILNFARSTQQKLTETTVQHEKTKEDRRRLSDMVRRDWRSEFRLQTDAQLNLSADRNQARARSLGWFVSAGSKSTDTALEMAPLEENKRPRPNFGAPVRLPFAFKLTVLLQLPENNPGAPLIFIGTNANFQTTESTRIIEIGTERAPGARITWNNTIIAEHGSFALAPGKEYVVEIVRSVDEPLLTVFVNDEEIMRFAGTTEPVNPDDTYIGVGVRGGQARLLDFIAAVRGMSREMLRSLLEMGDGLVTQVREQALARKLYERVLREDAPQNMLIHAYTGFSRSLARDKKIIIDDCQSLLESIRQSKSRRMLPGEEEYLTGLALARYSPAEAIRTLRLSSEKALSAAKKRLLPDGVFWSGPFAPGSTPQPALLSLFNPMEIFSTINGDRTWSQLRQDGQGAARLPPVESANIGVVYFVAQLFSSEATRDIYTYYPDFCQLWINGRPAKVEAGESEGQRSAAGRFIPGDNILLLEIPAARAAQGFYLHAYETGVGYSNIYGLLARLEEVLAELRADHTARAVELLSVLQNDGTLETLAKRFSPELKARGAAQVILQKTDEMLEKSKTFETAWNLLEALRTLDDGGGGKELALRYQRLGKQLETQGKPEEADAVYQQAATLSPQWHLPVFDRAKLLYRIPQTRNLGRAAFSEAFVQLPDSLELRLATAGFFLQPDNSYGDNPERIPPLPSLALEAALAAAEISARKSPAALSYCAQALLMLDRPQEALQYNEEARLLEETPERAALSKRIRTRLGR